MRPDFQGIAERQQMILRALLFGFLTWMPVHCLMKLWQMFSTAAASNPFVVKPKGWEVIFYSAPYPDYFVIAIAIGAGLVTVVWMLGQGSVPGWKALGVTSVIALAASACMHHQAVKMWEYSWFTPWSFKSDLVSPRVLSILILDIEAAIISSILWKWRCQWLQARRSAPVAGDHALDGVPAALPPLVKPFRAPDPFEMAVVVVGLVSLLAWGGAWLASSPAERGEANHRAFCEWKLAGTRKDNPRLWIAVARDTARAREAEAPETGVAELWQEIIELEEVVDGKDSEDAISDTFFLADFLLKYRRPAEAEKWLRRYIDACARRNGEDHPFLDSARSKLATALRDQGKQNETK